VRSLSTVPARSTSRLSAGIVAGAAVAGWATYECTSLEGRAGVRLMIAMRSPLMMEGPKTIAGEKGTVSERSFVMVRPRLISSYERSALTT
jgi:nucleoside-diphosphate kinase